MWWNFDGSDRGNALWIISIREDDLLISGSDVYSAYISLKMDVTFDADRWGRGDQSTYSGLVNWEVGDSDFGRVIPDPDNYEEELIISKSHTKGRGGEAAR